MFTRLPLHLRLAALPMVALLIGYPFFPAHFNWFEDMEKVSAMTRQIFWVHNFFIVLLLLLQTMLLLKWTRLVATPSPAGMALAIGLLSFWSLRLVMQVGFYGVELWWGKPFETVMHIITVLGLLYMTFVFGWAVKTQRAAPAPAM